MDTPETNKEAVIFPKGETGSPDYFTGVTWVTPLLQRSEEKNYQISNVVFEAAARTNWHTHPAGQVLLVTEGDGFYQEKGQPARPISKGDVVDIPADVEHWHGSAGERFVHVAVTNFKNDQNVIWLQPVTNEEYNSVIADQH